MTPFFVRRYETSECMTLLLRSIEIVCRTHACVLNILQNMEPVRTL